MWKPCQRTCAVNLSLQERRNQLFQRLLDDASSVCDKYAWAIPSEAALRVLAHFSPIVEIGCGAGYWAHCMQQRDIEVAAYDRYPAMTCGGEKRALWTTVAARGPKVLRKRRHEGQCALVRHVS